MSLGRASLAIAAIALLASASQAARAAATFHLVSIREVYVGSIANPNSEYVELQMWSGGQELVAGHVVRTYSAAGSVTGTDSFPANVANGTNQSTLVLATPEAEAEFGFLADAPMASSDRLKPGSGAVCWEALDCVAWGGFAGTGLPSPPGPPTSPSGIPDASALRRTIAPGCPTLLEASDDRDDSAADFAPAFPAPRPNSVPPSERGCSGSAGGGGATGTPTGRRAPQTILRRKPPKRSRDRSPTFRFGADEAGAKFQCRLDKRAFRPCKSPYTAKPLSLGGHVFKVRARDDTGATDPSPASYAFRVLPPR